MTFKIITILLICFAGFFNSIMDVLRFRWDTCIFKDLKFQQWIDPKLSWHNKWILKSKLGDLILSTVLVWITDLWHFSKMLMIFSFLITMFFYTPIFNYWILDLILFKLCFSGTFELFFSFIFIKKSYSSK